MTDPVVFYVSLQCFPQEQLGKWGRPKDGLRETEAHDSPLEDDAFTLLYEGKGKEKKNQGKSWRPFLVINNNS